MRRARLLALFPGLLALALAGIAMTGCDGVDVEPRAEDPTCAAFRGDPGSRGLVVISSDYSSSVVSLLSWDGETRTPSLWSSARRDPGLSTALSGDVGAALSPDPHGDVAVFDRANGVLSWISPTSCTMQVETQSGNEGLSANPYDVVTSQTLDRTFVARFGERADRTEGGDLLVLGADRRTVEKKIPLGTFVTDADPRARATPARLVLLGDRLFVSLQGFFGQGSGFEEAIDATVVEIDARTLAPKGSPVRIPSVKNCGAMVLDGERRLVLACSGVLAEGVDRATRLGASALVTIDLDSDQMKLGLIVPAASSIDQSFKPVLAMLPSGRVLTAGFGVEDTTVARDKRDRWFTVALDPAVPAAAEILDTSPFQIGDVACRGAVCWGADSSAGGRMRRFEERAAIVSLTGEVVLDAALPPRSLGRF